jgi:hypothetical protein
LIGIRSVTGMICRIGRKLGSRVTLGNVKRLKSRRGGDDERKRKAESGKPYRHFGSPLSAFRFSLQGHRMTEQQRDTLRIGFLAAIRVADRGHVGGLLVTNHLGRPLEFQCTAPVQPNRTQEILYGPTLEPYLMGEVIGGTLVEKMRVPPDVVLVDDRRLLPLREHVNVPVGCLLPDEQSDGPIPPGHDTVTVGDGRLLCLASDCRALARLERTAAAEADLAEPFDRVREALREVMGAATRREAA